MINPEYPIVALFQKTPAEVKWIPINWGPAYPSETISSSEWSAEGLTIVSSAIDGKIARALVGGGTAGAEGYAENKITLNTGEIRVARVKFEVK